VAVVLAEMGQPALVYEAPTGLLMATDAGKCSALLCRPIRGFTFFGERLPSVTASLTLAFTLG
jgi:hypothetical protein